MRAVVVRLALLLTALLLSAWAPTVSHAQSPQKSRTSAKIAPTTPPDGVPTIPEGVQGPKVPETFEAIFAERDTRAHDALDYLRCMQSTVSALQAGVLGNVPRAWSMACVQQGAEWRGVFGELTESAPGIQVQLQFAMRGKGQLVRDVIDTLRVNGSVRGLLRGLSAPLVRGGVIEFVPIALPQKGFLEVWFLPVPGDPSRVVVGGDSLIQMSTDGMRELGHSRTTPAIRQFAIVPTAPNYTLDSREERIPLLSELVIARMALGMVPEVHVRTRQYDSIISRSSGAWKHVRR